MKRFVGVRELKDKLSSYVRAARAGKTIIITDRGEPVAELRPISRDTTNDKLEQMIAEGLVRPPQIPGRGLYPKMPTVGQPGIVERLLDAERGE